MSQKSIRVLTHLTAVLLAICGGILAFADKVHDLPIIPPALTPYWGLLLAAAGAAKPILLAIGDMIGSDSQISQSFNTTRNAVPGPGKPGVPVAALALFSACLIGCSTTTSDPVKNARNAGLNAAGQQALSEAATVLGKVAVSSLYSIAQSEAGGGKVDYQQSLTSGLWANVNAVDTFGAFTRIANAYSAGKTPATVKAAADALGSSITPQKIDAIASVISTATGAAPSVQP